VPDELDKRVEFIKKLSQIGITPRSYITSYEKDDMTRYLIVISIITRYCKLEKFWQK